MKRTVFDLPRMDCPSEERLVRMALENKANVARLDFDLANRRLAVTHHGSPDAVLSDLTPLNLGARITSSEAAEESSPPPGLPARASPDERGTLRLLLAINATMFVVEVVAGWIAQSTGLIADSLDMFADAAVYGISLYAVGKAASVQWTAARMSGYLQLLLALGALFEVARRFVVGSEPEPFSMMGIALLALVANVACMALIAKHREGGVHMRASWIFSTNDVIANIGVIVAGSLVAWTGSALPDLVIGTAIALVVLSGAVRILRISRGSQARQG
jgi:Co/Zn/Cd efflux system component